MRGRHRQELDARILLDALEIDLQATRRVAKLRKVTVQLRHPPADGGAALDKHHIAANLGRFDRRRLEQWRERFR